MNEIKAKISASKIGGLNPNASAIKCKNVTTGQELFFETVSECKSYFKETNHNFITKRCAEQTKYLYKGEWLFAYLNNDYVDDYKFEKAISIKRAIEIIEIDSGNNYLFSSYANAESYFGLKRGFFSKYACRHKNELYWEKCGYRIFVLE